MKNPLMVLKPVPQEDIILPSVPENVDQEAGKNLREVIRRNVIKVENRELNTHNIESAIGIEAVGAVMGHENESQTKLFLTDLDIDDMIDDAVLTPALQEQLMIEAEETNDQTKIASIVDSMDCLHAIITNPELVADRAFLQEKLELGWSATRKKLLNDTSGDNMEVHHEIRRADKPQHTLNSNILLPMPKQEHKAEHAAKRKQAEQWFKAQKTAINTLNSSYQPNENE